MSKKKKIIIAVSSVLGVLLLVCSLTINYFIKKEEMEQIEANKPKCVNAATEQQVRYILNKPTEDISIDLYLNEVRDVTLAFGEPQSVWPNEDGLYAFSEGDNDVPPTPEEYMDEKYLEFSLWLYMHQTEEILAIEDIEKLVTEGNAEKKAEIDAYVDWYGGGGEKDIKYYTRKYDGDWDALTLQQQQNFVLEQEAKQKQEELENSTYE